MTFAEREEIAAMQRAGRGYKAISTALGLPVNTVKSFCRRHPVEWDGTLCKQCGKKLVVGRPGKQFCSAKCRMAWWSMHPDQLNRAVDYAHRCERCGRQFTSHKRDSRFCSRICYAEARKRG